MHKAKIKLAFSMQILLAGPCFADNWSINNKNEHPPEVDENRIIKWCDDVTGKNIRYSSANIKISGYHPCGNIVSSNTCDAENNKILGNPKTGIFKECGPSSIKNSPSSSSSSSIEPLSHKELKDLKSAMKKAADTHNSDPEVQLQILTDKLLANFMGNSGSNEKDLSKLINVNDTQKIMEELMSKLEKSLPQLDPQTKKLVEPLLKNFKKTKY